MAGTSLSTCRLWWYIWDPNYSWVSLKPGSGKWSWTLPLRNTQWTTISALLILTHMLAVGYNTALALELSGPAFEFGFISMQGLIAILMNLSGPNLFHLYSWKNHSRLLFFSEGWKYKVFHIVSSKCRDIRNWFFILPVSHYVVFVELCYFPRLFH